MSELMSRQMLRHDCEDDSVFWHTLMSSGNASESERQEFQRWLQTRPENSVQYAELEEMSATIGQLQMLLPEIGKRRPLTLRSRPILGMALAAGLAALAVGVFLHMRPDAKYVAVVGETRRLELPDGSLLTLSSSSEVRQRFDEQARSLDLEAGQAFFEVKKDAARPFIVHAGSVSIRAVGTQFDVVRRPSGLTVTVLEGRVAVEESSENALDGKTGTLIYVSAGEQVAVDFAGTLVMRRHEQESSAGSWRVDQLVFHGQPLADVLTDLGRYLPERIVLAESELGTLPVSAVVNTRDPYSMLDAIARSLGLEQERSSNTITLHSRDTG